MRISNRPILPLCSKKIGTLEIEQTSFENILILIAKAACQLLPTNFSSTLYYVEQWLETLWIQTPVTVPISMIFSISPTYLPSPSFVPPTNKPACPTPSCIRKKVPQLCKQDIG